MFFLTFLHLTKQTKVFILSKCSNIFNILGLGCLKKKNSSQK